MKNRLTNPFRYLAGGGALAAGLAVMALTALIARYSHAHFDGAIDMHAGAGGSWPVYLAEPLVAWLCLAACLYVAGLLASNTRIRPVDMAGTTALSRAPMLLAALAAFLLPDRFDPGNIPPAFWLATLLILGTSIWMIVLLYQAFTISANLRGVKAGIAFTLGLIAAEICAQLLLHVLYPLLS